MMSLSNLLLVGVLVLYASLLAVVGYAIFSEIRRSDHSGWYYAGIISGWVSFSRRRPVTGVIAGIVAVVILISLLTAIQDLSSLTDDDSNPPPEIAPIYESTLRMPTDYPFERLRLKWPAFFGHRFKLGGDRA